MVRLKTCYLGALLGSLLLSTSTSYAAKVVFVVQSGNGEMYQLRWGYTEIGQDPLEMIETLWGSVETPDPENPIKDSAVAFKLGSRVGVKIIWEEGEKPCVWAVTSSLLQSRLTSDIYWAEGACNAPGGHGIHQPDEIHWFPEDMPYFVEWAELIGDVVTCEPVIDPFDSFDGRRSDIFIILDAPKEPMNPAWASLLKYSCTWARYRPDENGISQWDAITTNENDAAQRITLGYFFQRPGMVYNGGYGAEWITWSGSYRFHLKDILYAWDAGGWVWGECMDASMMDAIAKRSIGISDLTRQITSTDGGFITNPICQIGDNPANDWQYQSFPWAFHSIVVKEGESFSDSTAVWDPTAAQKKNLLGSTYRNPPAFRTPNHSYWRQKRYWRTVHLGEVLGLVYWHPSGDYNPVRSGWLLDEGYPTVYEDWITPIITTLPRH